MLTTALKYDDADEDVMIEIESNIPGAVKEFTYVKNHHYLRLKDDKGNETKLLENGVIRYWCVSCTNVWFQPSDLATVCPNCKGSKISKQWMKPQLALIPEDESSFTMPQDKDK